MMSRPHVIFSITRDPVERAASLYMLVKRSPDWIPLLSQRVGDRDFAYFYEACVDQQVTFPNGLCNQIANGDDFASAAAFIATNYSFVGSSERMDLVREALTERIRPFVPDFRPLPLRTNAAMHGMSLQEIVPVAVAERIREHNFEDYRLHRWIEANGIIFGSQDPEPHAWAPPEAQSDGSSIG